MNPERIRLFITGGTFDKEYDELAGQLYFKERICRKCSSSAVAI